MTLCQVIELTTYVNQHRSLFFLSIALMNVYRLDSQKMDISMSLAATMDTRTISTQRRATAICYSGENSFGHLIKSHTTFYNKDHTV